MTHDGRYQANFTKGGLMVPESRRVAELLLAGVDAAGWKQAIEGDNLLRKRSPTTASTKALLIRARLRTMTEGLWRLVRDGDRPVATQALFAATITYSPLVGDFMDLVVRDLYRRFEERLKAQHWDRYVEDCHTRDPRTPDWSAGTLTSLRTRVFGMLTEAGYLSDARTRTLRPLTVAPTVAGYLRTHGRDYALRCMEVDPRAS
ncbi:DUF1819 family protein [Candidatus Thiodictyon syntrophicum]|uniref:DUF1819 domain-containing protein n=1 Tax=Candidatus Thiodictyon syntrophicum TaxID=1166950 RepID=A0A2K8UBW9_9GAMM|nr:DUF1819 family protein [Candidatus Thiodictyon syntrophicum]AUB83045.1 hypothetical protein THSYN_20260 [Candidatus Thiodictyon syntrophicum]